MLGSITPLGERGRGQRYIVTMGFFLFGSVLAGAGMGAALGALGSLIRIHGTVPLVVLTALLAVGLVFDLGIARRKLPTIERQVDETWLFRYRGWVYGLGFGLQLGLGVVTIVTASATYVAMASALLSGSIAAGLLIGGVFGLVRWVGAATGGFVRRPNDLARAAGLISRLDRPARRATAAVQLGALAAALAVIFG